MTKQTAVAANAELSINECVTLVEHLATKRTVLIRGHMGWGKSSMRHMLAERTGNPQIYLDCTRLEPGDLWLPNFKDVTADSGACVRFVPNESLGMHLGRPVDVLIDEFGKATRPIQNALMAVMLERFGLPKGSRVYATTNLTMENVGDSVMPHHRNRIVEVNMRKSTGKEWGQWALVANLDPVIIHTAEETPDFFDSFTEVTDPKNNSYIYDPRDPSRLSFVTGRSLEAASDVLKTRAYVGEAATRAALIGTIGGPAAEHVMSYVHISDKKPKYEAIVANPKTTEIPEHAGVLIMTVLTCIQRVMPEDFAEVFTYIKRMPMEAQGMFVTQIMTHPKKMLWAYKMPDFTKFAQEKHGLFVK